MSGMFEEAAHFNQDIGLWDVSSVGKSGTNTRQVQSPAFGSFDRMFYDASDFNWDIGQWDVSSAQSMSSMFENAASFNQDIRYWNVSSVRSFGDMFKGAENFKQNLCTWGSKMSTGAAPSVGGMFQNTRCFYAHEDPDVTAYPPGPICYGCAQF